MTTLRELVARNHLDPSTPQTNGWEEYAKDRTDTPTTQLCTVRDGLNRATVYIEESGIVLANYASGSCLYENREAWLDAMPDLDREAVLIEFPEVALGTCFEIESDEPSELLRDGVEISLERIENWSAEYAQEVRMHDSLTGENRIVSHEDECTGETERSAYRECIQRGEAIAMGITVAEPVR